MTSAQPMSAGVLPVTFALETPLTRGAAGHGAGVLNAEFAAVIPMLLWIAGVYDMLRNLRF